MVEADSYFLELVRYIHLNPVRAGLISKPDGYAWSGRDDISILKKHIFQLPDRGQSK